MPTLALVFTSLLLVMIGLELAVRKRSKARAGAIASRVHWATRIPRPVRGAIVWGLTMSLLLTLLWTSIPRDSSKASDKAQIATARKLIQGAKYREALRELDALQERSPSFRVLRAGALLGLGNHRAAWDAYFDANPFGAFLAGATLWGNPVRKTVPTEFFMDYKRCMLIAARIMKDDPELSTFDGIRRDCDASYKKLADRP